MAQLEIKKIQWIPLIMTFLLVLSVSLPYLISVGLGNVDFFIPYISHAAAFPPQSAHLSIFTTLSFPFALGTFALRYAIMNHRSNSTKQKRSRFLNIISMMFGLFSMLSMMYYSHNPLGIFVRNDYEWVRSVAIPHLIGVVVLFFCLTSYVLTQAYLTFMHKTNNSTNVFVHATLGMTVVLTCWTTCIPFYAALAEIVPNLFDEETGSVNLEWTKYGFYYIITSLSEWGFTLFSLLFIATFYKDFQNTSVRFELKPKVPDLIFSEPPSRQVLNVQEVTKM